MKNLSFYSPEIWAKNYWICITSWYNQRYKKFTMPTHNHERLELMHVIGGNAEIDVYNDIGNKGFNNELTFVETIRLTAGETIFIDSGAWHNLRIKEGKVPCSIVNIEFVFQSVDNTQQTFGKVFQHHKGIIDLLSKKLPYIVTRDTNDNFTTFFVKLIDELEAFDIYGDKESQVNALFIILFQQYLRRYMDSINKKPYMQYVRKAVQYIEEFFDNDISVEIIANYVNVNKSYLQQVFTEQVGETIGSFITRLRIDKAKTILKFTNTPIVDIAVQVGYSTRQGFSVAFLKVTGTSGKAYREKYKRLDGEPSFHNYEKIYTKENSITSCAEEVNRQYNSQN